MVVIGANLIRYKSTLVTNTVKCSHAVAEKLSRDREGIIVVVAIMTRLHYTKRVSVKRKSDREKNKIIILDKKALLTVSTQHFPPNINETQEIRSKARPIENQLNRSFPSTFYKDLSSVTSLATHSSEEKERKGPIFLQKSKCQADPNITKHSIYGEIDIFLCMLVMMKIIWTLLFLNLFLVRKNMCQCTAHLSQDKVLLVHGQQKR